MLQTFRGFTEMIFTWGYLVMVLVRPQEFVPGFQGLPIMPVLLLLATLSWIMSKKDFRTPHFSLVFLFLLATAFSRVANGWLSGAIDWFVAFAPICLVFYLVAGSLNSTDRLRFFMATMVLCSTVMAAHGIGQAETGVGFTGATLTDGRITYLGMFNDPNDLGLFFVMSLPMAIYLLKRTPNLLKKMFWAACILTILYGVVLTDSRGTLLATLMIFGLMVLRWKGPLVAGMIATPLILAMLLLPSRLQELDSSEASAAGRVEAWYEGIQMFKSNPLFGVGAGQFTDYHYLTAHNSFVLVLAESGMFGFTLFLAMIGYSLLMTYRLARLGQSPEKDRPPDPWIGHPDDEPVVTSFDDLLEPDAPEPTVSDSADPKLVGELKAMGFTMLLSVLGFCCAAFFLSRAYTIVLYVQLGMVVSLYLIAQSQVVSLPEFKFSRDIFYWSIISIMVAFGLFVIVRILLATS